jgi:hypothetical protein
MIKLSKITTEIREKNSVAFFLLCATIYVSNIVSSFSLFHKMQGQNHYEPM